MSKIIECIPNFSEGQNQSTIQAIALAIKSVNNVTLKCIDTGFYANRTVYTFLGEMEAVLEAAYRAIKVAHDTIDMRTHHGTHPRFGAIDVCPFVALEEGFEDILILEVTKLAECVASEFNINTFLYEKSTHINYRKNLAAIRKGEYEGLSEKIKLEKWKPDFGGSIFQPKMGGMAIGVRDILVAFNVNLDTKDVLMAKKIAKEIRYSGVVVTNENGEKIRTHGICPGVKALGWYIKDYDMVQVSMNIVDYTKTPIHIAFKTIVLLAKKYNINVLGAELIGCIPRQCLIDAGKYFFEEEKIETKSISDSNLIEKAIDCLGLESVKPFDVVKNVLL